jgi:hypothetical protein
MHIQTNQSRKPVIPVMNRKLAAAHAAEYKRTHPAKETPKPAPRTPKAPATNTRGAF